MGGSPSPFPPTMNFLSNSNNYCWIVSNYHTTYSHNIMHYDKIIISETFQVSDLLEIEITSKEQLGIH